MLENPTQSQIVAIESIPVIKRYAPPNQRNCSLNRRKSGDQFDRISNPYVNNGEKNQPGTSRNISRSESGLKLIPLEWFSRSEAAQFLKNRWRSAIHSYNDTSIDLSERPTMYTGNSASAWGPFRLPHQMMAPANCLGPSPGTQIDFLAELHRQMQTTDAGFDNKH